MKSKKLRLTNFSRALYSESLCIRPDNEKELIDYLINTPSVNLLARGAGLSYSDSCLNQDHLIVDTSRLNHFIDFNEHSGIVICQGRVTFKDLYLLHPDFMPPVTPGTLHASIAGGIALDVHGKNNHVEGSLGDHIVWIELLINNQIIRCSHEENGPLFQATIGGLGLTGIILRVALRLKKAPRFVEVENSIFETIPQLIGAMSDYGVNYDYQVAWIDLLNHKKRSVLSTAKYNDVLVRQDQNIHSIPKLPFNLIKAWNIKLFNRFFIHTKKAKEQLCLEEFNSPLDKIMHWNRLYGPKGLIQFQAVFDQEQASDTLDQLMSLIHLHKATPTLSVLKLLKKQGPGLLSFCQPGFTLAIDFIHNKEAIKAITAMNQLISDLKGRIYLAKDLLLSEKQYQTMYPNHEEFSQILNQYKCPMHSDLSKRLGITP